MNLKQKYWIFASEQYEARGGMDDLQKTCDSLVETEEICRKLCQRYDDVSFLDSITHQYFAFRPISVLIDEKRNIWKNTEEFETVEIEIGGA